MITQKCFWRNEEIVIFDTSKSPENKTWRFYRVSKVPEDAQWEIIDNPDHQILQTIAINSGEEVTRQFYVTPPDKLESWMGRYTYLPNGQWIHCDPIMYGDEDKNRDISENTMNFALDHLELFAKEDVPVDDKHLQ